MNSTLSQLKKYKIRPKKRFSQNFLLDEDMLESIINLYDLQEDEIVVEIGAGLGALTERLAPRVKRVIALEIDTTLVHLLKDKIIRHSNVDIVNKDVLQFDFSGIAKEYGGRFKVLGNIPYSISAPLIFKLSEYKDFLSIAVLLLQKEVADRIVASPGTKAYGVLSVFSQVDASVSMDLTIPRQCFYPQPKVDSALVRFQFLKTLHLDIEDIAIFKKLVRASFAQRRKILKNTLKNSLSLNISFEEILQAVILCGIDPGRRGETLSLEEFKNLSNTLSKYQSHSVISG
ncbi:MAG: 16S rRNA (adenine(1518)-N(6)/adenine(1519)-N(6))-dimethyltransferase RsmA [Thermodesulfobacteriota bacterium]|nr:16S rRNA (adenine(1518)-N(6)/adenine(1519)-N(6))-dimethyltransferase RsmA [Thermodesulfobacteriota bacterium]